MAYTDLVMNGDRLLVSIPHPFDPKDRQHKVYIVVNTLKHQAREVSGSGKIFKINTKNNGSVYIGRNPVIARV
jgi:hypothetical protein